MQKSLKAQNIKLYVKRYNVESKTQTFHSCQKFPCE